jgi:phosphate transport system permease protein
VFQWIADHNAGVGAFEGPVLGQSLLLASLVLAVMILPIITAVVREVLATTPVDQCEAALALGATRWEMIRGAMLPWARSGIVGASALGLGRALGETIAVAMVLGSQPTLLGSLLGSGQTIAGTIAFQYNSADSALHSSSLIAMAILLLVVSLLVSLLSRALVARTGSRGAGRLRGALDELVQRLRSQVARAWSLVRPRRPPMPGSPWIPSPPRRLPSVGRLRRVRSRCVEVMVVLCVGIAMVPLVLVIGYCVVKGAGALSVDFLSSDGEPDLAGNGIKHALVGTLILVGIATAVAVPLGVLTALFLREAATQGAFLRRTAGAIGGFIDVMLGVPSVVAGLTVAIAVVVTFGFSAIAGGLALAFIMYPIVVRAADEILRLIPEAQVDAAMALGAPRWRAAWAVVLPAAAPGILTGVMIAVARVSGETAPLLVTSDSSQFFSTDITSSIAALPVYIFNGTINSTVPVAQQHAWGAALVLVAIVLFFNLSARLVSRLANHPRSA